MLRVSLCDDDENFRTMVRFVLSGEADIAVVSESCDGRECVEHIAETRPDAVLLDLVMPEMLGFEVITRLADVAPQTKVIVLSSQSSAGLEETVRRLGAVAFIDKATDELVDLLPGQVRAALAA